MSKHLINLSTALAVGVVFIGLAGCGGDDDEAAAEPPVATVAPRSTTTTTQSGVTTTTTGGDDTTPPGPPGGEDENGNQLPTIRDLRVSADGTKGIVEGIAEDDGRVEFVLVFFDDGVSEQVTVDAEGRFRAEHDYGVEGSGKTYPIRVLPHDDTQVASEYTESLTIENANQSPTVTLTVRKTGNRVIATGTVSDPEGRGPLRVTILWGDGVQQELPQTDSRYDFVHDYDPSFPGGYNITVTAYDVDGQTGRASRSVSIDSV